MTVTKNAKHTRTESTVGTVAFHTVQRETGTLVIVERTGPGHWLDQQPGWLVICDAHGGSDLYGSKWQAVEDARTPSLFCEGCATLVKAGLMYEGDTEYTAS